MDEAVIVPDGGICRTAGHGDHIQSNYFLDALCAEACLGRIPPDAVPLENAVAGGNHDLVKILGVDDE